VGGMGWIVRFQFWLLTAFTEFSVEVLSKPNKENKHEKAT